MQLPEAIGLRLVTPGFGGDLCNKSFAAQLTPIFQILF
jgi:hypothetical protein